MIKTLFQLFLAFAKIGFTSFGGTSMIPLIMEEMLSHNWMSADDVANIVAIAEMTPGSLGVNCATFAGTQTAGVLGGTAAVIGVLTPTLTLTLVAALFFQKFMTCVEIVIALCIFFGLFTWFANAVTIGLVVVFCLSGMFYWVNIWMIFVALALMNGSGRMQKHLGHWWYGNVRSHYDGVKTR